MKTKLMKLFLVLGIILFTSLISSCRCNKDPYDSIISGDFIYTTRSCEKGYVKIIGLSEKGQKKETIVFPSVIDGYKVFSLGCHNGTLNQEKQIFITNASRVYFPGGYVSQGRVYSVYYELNENVKSLSVYIGNSNVWEIGLYPPSNLNFNGESSKIFRSNLFYQNRIQKVGIEKVYEHPANVCYYLDEETTYFVDDVDGTIVNVIPPVPYKEGYDFIGWYKDPNHQEKWNFEEDIVPSKKYNENGEYEFVETKIYAAWEKVD